MKEAITICIPIKDDATSLLNLLASISRSDIAEFDYEIIVCDSYSTDNVEDIVEQFLNDLNIYLIRTLKNANASENLNAGIARAKGEVFVRLDSHCCVSSNYFSIGVSTLKAEASKVCGVGPSVKIESKSGKLLGKAIASAYVSPFFMGPSKYKRSIFFKRYTGFVSSIYCGFFWTRDLREINGFDVCLVRKQDIEMLNRLQNHTEKRLLNNSDLVLRYTMKHDSLWRVSKRSFIQGKLLTTSLKDTPIKHTIPATFLVSMCVLSVAAPIFAIYLLIVYFFTIFIASMLEKHHLVSALYSLLIFPSVHIAYFLGNIFGVLELLIYKADE